MRNLTISGEIDAATGDFSGAVDVAGAFTSSTGATITTADNTNTLSLISTDADGSTGPNLLLYRNSSSPAVDDNTGKIAFQAENDADQAVEYFSIRTYIQDETDGTEDGHMQIVGITAGAAKKRLDLTATEAVFNDDSLDINFRVESNDNTHMIFVDAGNNHVNIGQAADSEHTLNVNGNGFFTTADNTDTLTLESTDADANSGPVLCLHRNSGSPADSDLIGRIDFSGESDLGSEQNFAVIKTFADDVSHGTENGQFSLFTRVGGSEIERMTCGAAATVFNDGSASIDFRVEGNGDAHLLFLDASADTVGIGTNNPATHKLQVTGEFTGSSNGTALFQNTHSSVEAGDEVVRIQFSGDNNATGGHFINFFDSGGDIGRINVSSASATAYATSSDYRLKENIVDLDNAISRIKEIQPRRFSFIRQANCTLDNILLEDGDSVLVESENIMTDGFIAHELQDDLPEAVDGAKDANKIVPTYYKDGDSIPDGKEIGDEDGGTEVKPFIQAVDYAKITPLLTAALQEAIAKIEVLEDKVKSLEDA